MENVEFVKNIKWAKCLICKVCEECERYEENPLKTWEGCFILGGVVRLNSVKLHLPPCPFTD